MWKDIFVLGDGEDSGAARLRVAAALAERNKARLGAHAFVLRPQFIADMGAGALADAYAELLEEARREANAAHQAMAAAGPPVGERYAIHVDQALKAEIRAASAAAARVSDLAVLPTPGEALIATEAFNGAALDAACPCLLIPPLAVISPFGERILVAWKATPEASRAVRAALPWLVKAAQVRLVMVNPRGAAHDEDERALERLAAHLVRHGAPIEETMIRTTDLESVGDVVVAEAEAFRADMMVMGAFGHARAREFVFGGVTRQMLRDAAMPTLVAH